MIGRGPGDVNTQANAYGTTFGFMPRKYFESMTYARKTLGFALFRPQTGSSW